MPRPYTDVLMNLIQMFIRAPDENQGLVPVETDNADFIDNIQQAELTWEDRDLWPLTDSQVTEDRIYGGPFNMSATLQALRRSLEASSYDAAPTHIHIPNNLVGNNIEGWRLPTYGATYGTTITGLTGDTTAVGTGTTTASIAVNPNGRGYVPCDCGAVWAVTGVEESHEDWCPRHPTMIAAYQEHYDGINVLGHYHVEEIVGLPVAHGLPGDRLVINDGGRAFWDGDASNPYRVTLTNNWYAQPQPIDNTTREDAVTWLNDILKNFRD
jgi:hypothetical protein